MPQGQSEASSLRCSQADSPTRLFMRRAWYLPIKGDANRKIKPALPAELHSLRLHDSRHSAASMLIAQRSHPKIIQERLDD